MLNKIKEILFLKRESIYLLLAMAGVYFTATRFVDGTKSLSIYGDELGYWQGAAFFLGIDWSEIASVNEYYGIGYGLLLAPIMKIWKSDPAVMMQMAVRMQGILLASCVLIAYKCINMITKKISGLYKIILITVTVLYPCNLLYVNIILSECILNWCTWILFFLYLKYMKENKDYQIFLILTLSVYMYLIHARTIAILMATLIVLFLIYRYQGNLRIKKKKIIYFTLFILFFILMLFLIKRWYIESFYSKAITSPVNGNLAGQVDSAIRKIASYDRIIETIYSILGKLYYVVIGSFFLVGFGIIMCVKIIFNSVRTKETNKCLPFLWLLLVFVFAWGIEASYMSSGFEYRSDILIYGRYLEYVCGPLILIGMIYLFQKPEKKYINIILCIGLILSVVIVERMSNEALNSNIWVNSSVIANHFFKMDNKAALLYSTVSRCFLIFILIYQNQFDYKKYRNVVVSFLVVIGAFWIIQFNTLWIEHVVPWRNDICEKQNSILDVIGDNAFVLYDAQYPGFFQFLRVESEVYVCHSIEECIGCHDIQFIISDTNCKESNWIAENANIIIQNNRYMLWTVQ